MVAPFRSSPRRRTRVLQVALLLLVILVLGWLADLRPEPEASATSSPSASPSAPIPGAQSGSGAPHARRAACDAWIAHLRPDRSPWMTRGERAWYQIGTALYDGLAALGIPAAPFWPRVVEASARLDPTLGLAFVHHSGLSHDTELVARWAEAYPGTLAGELSRALVLSASPDEELLPTFAHPYVNAWVKAMQRSTPC